MTAGGVFIAVLAALLVFQYGKMIIFFLVEHVFEVIGFLCVCFTIWALFDQLILVF